MKRFFTSLIAAVSLLGMLTVTPFASAAEIGDKIGDVLSTDIVTYIEDVEVPSFNIAGRTAILVENLNAMGLPFEVHYVDSSRTLYIFDGESTDKDYFHFENAEFTDPIGTPIMDVLYTDIETYYAKEKLESFNIGGYTCVYATDFAELYGKHIWSEETREVRIFRPKAEEKGTISTKTEPLKNSADESSVTRGDAAIRWGSPEKSYITANADGTFCTVELADKIYIESYDSEFNYLSSFSLKKEFPIFGGALFGEEYNYIAFGQPNEKESDTLTVINLSVYDKNFKKLKDIPIKNCRTSVPFDASNVSMAENDDFLVLHTARSQYKEANGMAPQTQLTVVVNKKNWGIANNLDKFQPNHTSHSLKNYVRFDGDSIFTANYSDATPMRGAFMQEINSDGSLVSSCSVFAVGGPSAANCTGAMLGGFEISDTSYIFPISSIDHSLALDYSDTEIEGVTNEERDVFIVALDKYSKEAKTTRLTYYSGEGKTASVPYIVKLESGNFMLLWQKFSFDSNADSVVCYAFLDRDGNLLGSPLQAKGQLSTGCQPVEANGNVVWYTNTKSGRVFYAIDSDSSEHNIER